MLGLMDYFSRPFSLCHSIFISIIMAFIDESFIMMFIECVSMIMITIIVIVIMISMITTTAVLFCPPSVPVQPTRKKEGESESEGEELLIKWRVRRCSAKEREREKGRQLSRAAGQKCAHGGGEHRQSHSRALLRPGLEVRLWSSGEGSDKLLVSRCSQRRNIRRRAAVRARCCGAAVRPQPRCRAPSGRITGEAAQALLETWRVRATAEAVPRCSVAERSSDKRCWLGWQTLNPQQRDPPLKCDVTENNVAPTADVHAHPTGLNRRGKRRTSGGGGGLSIFRRTIRIWRIFVAVIRNLTSSRSNRLQHRLLDRRVDTSVSCASIRV